jgi:hypothetical protein
MMKQKRKVITAALMAVISVLAVLTVCASTGGSGRAGKQENRPLDNNEKAIYY